MDIIFVRHGEKENNDQNGFDLNLTKKGFAQADALGIRLKSFDISRIYSSDMVRARQTADTANKHLGLPISYHSELREIDMGVFQDGMEGLDKDYSDFFREFEKHETDMAYPGGENGARAWERMKTIIPELLERDENCLVVAHGGTIRVLLCGMLGIGFKKRFMLGSPVINCGITIVRYNREQKIFSLQLFNSAE